MTTYILRRLLHMIPLLLLISFFSFLLMDLAPGDFLTQMSLNPQISERTIEVMRVKFGLDRAWYIQYLFWIKNIFLHLDFGESFAYKVPVFTLIKTRLANTFLLALAAATLTWFLAVPFGILSAVRQFSWVDKGLSFVSFLGLSIPEVFFALLMIYFAATTGWFPIGGMRSLDYDTLTPFGKALDLLHHLLLPAIVLGTIPMAGRMRQMRANLLDVLRADYVTTARAKGLSERAVIWKHAVRNAINPMITLFGFTLAYLLSGSILVEVVMSWPGIGRLTIEALRAQDLYLIMGSVLMASTMLILGNLVADILLAVADPRITYD